MRSRYKQTISIKQGRCRALRGVKKDTGHRSFRQFKIYHKTVKRVKITTHRGKVLVYTPTHNLVNKKLHFINKK